MFTPFRPFSSQIWTFLRIFPENRPLSRARPWSLPSAQGRRHLPVAGDYDDSAHNSSWRLKMTKSNTAERSLADSTPVHHETKTNEKSADPTPSPLRGPSFSTHCVDNQQRMNSL